MRQFFAKLMGSSSVRVNGKTYQGQSVHIENGRVFVDGQEVSDESKQPRIEVSIQGDVHSLETAAGDVTVNGNAGSVSTVSGDVRCQQVGGSVSTVSGDVKCSNIQGRVSTVSGDVG